MSSSHADERGPDPVAVLGDLPEFLWGPLLRALRRAVDRLPRADLPAGLRPYAGWTPDSLAASRPRRAVAEAIAADFRLREEIGAAMNEQDAFTAASSAGTTRLVEAYGEDTAVAALVAHGRWDDLAVLAAEAAARLARQDRAAAEGSSESTRDELEDMRLRLSAELDAARDEREGQRRRADAAAEHLRREEAARRESAAEITRLQNRVAELDERLVEERRQRDRRVGRLHRRLEEAEARVRVDERRVADVIGRLERLTAELREALEPDPPAAGDAAVAPDPVVAGSGTGSGSEAVVPRTVGAALPGRPCRLPPGVTGDGATGTRALLQVSGLEVVLDGYNVTKDRRGRPQASLADQRQWLVKHAGGVAARFGVRLIVVFDGTEERPAPAPAARDVRVVFTVGEEIADERVRDIVAGLAPGTPVLVVSSDREVQEAADQLGANVASAGAFLEATGG